MEYASIQIVKRSGEKEPLNIENIRRQTIPACEGLNFVTYEELELNASIHFYDGMTSREIQNSLIESAHNLIDETRPDWTFAAARLSLYDLYHDISHLYGVKGIKGDIYKRISIKDYFNKFGHTLSDFYKTYSDSEIEELNSIIDSKKDLLFNYAAVLILRNTYLNRTSELDGDDINREVTQVVELPQHMLMSIAMFASQNESKDKRLQVVKDLYEVISNQYFIPATPHLSSGRVRNGNLASCLVTSFNDSIESINSGIAAVNLGSKAGAGWGIDISRVRSINAPIKGRANASRGKVPLCKVLDSLSLYIDQGGKTYATHNSDVA